MTYEKIEEYYRKGYWTAEMVKTAVHKGIISKGEYELITGEIYS